LDILQSQKKTMRKTWWRRRRWADGGGSGKETDLAALPRDAGTTKEVVDHEYAELSSGRAVKQVKQVSK